MEITAIDPERLKHAFFSGTRLILTGKKPGDPVEVIDFNYPVGMIAKENMESQTRTFFSHTGD